MIHREPDDARRIRIHRHFERRIRKPSLLLRCVQRALLSVAHALNDSPVGFLAWMYEVVHTDSDQKYTYEELITQAMLLWIPGVYGNIRSYREIEGSVGDWNKTKLPTSVLQFGAMDAYNDTEAFSYVVSFFYSFLLFSLSLFTSSRMCFDVTFVCSY